MSQLERLIADAEEEVPAAESDAYEDARFDDPGAREAATAWLRANPTAAGILLLLALRREAPEAYRSVPPETRAAILTAAMRDRASSTTSATSTRRAVTTARRARRCSSSGTRRSRRWPPSSAT